jgi:N-acetyl sugar amidotransferase
MRPMNYCCECVYPEIAVNLIYDDEGICSACRVAEEIELISEHEWKIREKKFVEILENGRKRSQSRYDCIVAVGGGKDSYWQAHIVKEYGFNPLLVTYHGNNYFPEGQGNLDRMREVLGMDHLVLGPSVKTLVKLNRVCFKKMGDMNWHNHAGIDIVPMTVAVKFRIPIVVWGEIPWDVSGMFSPEDYVRYNKRMVLEHDMRGFSWQDMVGEEGLEEKDLEWLRMPTDEEFAEVGVEGIYIGNFFHWDPNKQVKTMIEKYKWEPSRQPFERTYRRMSNLDDMHENGIHDYMKYIKFGYGRASDHASKDIRLNYMRRKEGIEMVRKYDHVKPRRDLARWLEYVDMTEEEFDRIADTFRDPRVWSKDSNGNWVKDNIWDFEERVSQIRRLS